MTFDSLQFIVFFVCMFFAYFAVPKRLQSWLLLLASCYFYMAFVPYYVLILFALITLDYFLAIAMEHRVGAHRHILFIISVCANLGTLFFFKYFNFFNQNVAEFAKFLHWNYSLGMLAVILPLGLSFHIFQSLAYIIEVYKGRYTAERHYHTYALYVMFFPQLVAGPIERPAHLLPQLQVAHEFDHARVVSGLQRMLWGFFKKIVIANWLAVLVDFIYHTAATANSAVLAVAVVGFAFQLYADFSGYCDIAIGAARVLGIELTQNFRQPYFSRSIAEFWRRWHISLSSWFRDYVYYPLAWKAGSLGAWWVYVAILITFVLTGLWHGAGWTYLIMGALFGTYIVLGQSTKRLRDRAWRSVGLDTSIVRVICQTGWTFALTAVTWVFFRAENLHQAVTVLSGLATRWSTGAFSFLTCHDYCSVYELGISRTELLLITCSIGIMFAYEYMEQLKSRPQWVYNQWVHWFACYFLILWILATGNLEAKTFIYFQF